MRILYLGPNSFTSKQRSDALVRLGHDVVAVDPARYVSKNPVFRKINWEVGGFLSQASVARGVLSEIGDARFDVTWVDSGRYVGPALVHALRRRGGPVLNYNVDDPFGKRDRLSWLLYLHTVPAYDLVAVVREENVAEANARGAKKVVRVYRSADEVAHAPHSLSDEDHTRWDSDVCFVGTWFPERGPFMAALVRLGVPLTIFGNGWQKAPEWPAIQPAWRGPGTKSDDEYAKAIQCAKICLGLLSKGNRDLHTTRSLEVPLLGGLLCAERTPEHLYLYDEGTEAIFWGDAAECAHVCRELLVDAPRRLEIAHRGRDRCIANGTLNERMMSRLLAEVLPERPAGVGTNLA